VFVNALLNTRGPIVHTLPLETSTCVDARPELIAAIVVCV